MTTENATTSTNERQGAQQSTGTAPDQADLGVVDVDASPPRPMQFLAVIAAVVGAALSAPFTTLAIPFGLAGVLISIVAVTVTYSVRWLTAGVGMLLLGILISGSYGALPPELLLLATGAVIVSWDAGQHGLVIGEQLGRDTRTRRLQLVHVAATTLVIGLVCSLVSLLYLFGADGQPGPAIGLALLGVLLLTWLFRQ